LIVSGAIGVKDIERPIAKRELEMEILADADDRDGPDDGLGPMSTTPPARSASQNLIFTTSEWPQIVHSKVRKS